MSEESIFKRFLKKVKGIKHIEIIIAVIAVVLMLILYFSTKIGFGKADTDSQSNDPSDYCASMEIKLQNALSSMKGVGKTKIVIHWESSVESIIANVTNSSANSLTTTPQLIQSQGSTKPIVLKDIYPKALGVIIICQGGDDVKTRINVMNAVSVLLNITQDRINVYAMEK